MTVWVFGDSYAEYYGLKDQWMHKVASTLKTDLKSFGLVGSSIEYTFDKFNSVRDNISKQDIIIIALTTYNRRWFFKEYPQHTAYPKPKTNFVKPKLIYSNTGFDEVDESLKMYETYLKNNKIHETYLLNFLYNLHDLTSKLNLHTIILINFYDTENFLKNKREEFPLFHFSKDKLLNISMNEYSKDYITRHDFSQPDIKVNHFIKSNHLILAKKIVNNIKKHQPIDPTTGFIRHIFNEKSLVDPVFVKKELFNGIIREKS